MGQMYVTTAIIKPIDPIKVNKQGGVTLSVRKMGGWSKTFKEARDLAAWPDPEAPAAEPSAEG